mgnify:CR=1 FL=1
MHHVAIFPEKFWPKGISLNETVIREGTKMSKSRGNVIPLADIAKKYSADLFRLYVASGADLDGIVDWREADVESLKKVLLGFASLVLEASKVEEPQQLDKIDRWLLSRFYRRLKRCEELLENLRIREFIVSMFFEALNDISYHRKRSSKERNLSIVRKILRDWVIVLSPIIPHICEEVWSRIRSDGDPWTINSARWPKVREEYIDTIVEACEEVVQRLIDVGREILGLLKARPQRAVIVIAARWKYKAFCKLGELIKQNIRNVKILMNKLLEDASLKPHASSLMTIVKRVASGRIQIPKIMLDRDTEYEALSEAKDYVARELGLGSIRVAYEEDIEEKLKERASKALPMRPVIIFLE